MCNVDAAQEGSLLKHKSSLKMGRIKMDYPHKKVLHFTDGTHLEVPKSEYQNWVEVVRMIDFTTGLEYVQEVC
jgi:hypothetical protein